MLTPEQLELKKKSIGGTDASKIMKVNPWESPLYLHQWYTGKVERSFNEQAMDRMWWGTEQEPLVKKFHHEKTGDFVCDIEDTLVHPEHSFIHAHIDGLVCYDEDLYKTYKIHGGIENAWKLVKKAEYGVEVKTSQRYDDWRNGVPNYYYWQVVHYANVTGINDWYVLALIGVNDFKSFKLRITKEDKDKLLESELKFWERVQYDVPPDPSGYKIDLELLDQVDQSEFIEADKVVFDEKHEKGFDFYFHLCKNRYHNDEVKRHEKLSKEHEALIKAQMLKEKVTKLKNPGDKVLVNWSTVKPKPRVDWQGLANEAGYSEKTKEKYTNVPKGWKQFRNNINWEDHETKLNERLGYDFKK